MENQHIVIKVKPSDANECENDKNKDTADEIDVDNEDLFRNDDFLKRKFSVKLPKKTQVRVESRIVFLKIGQIDTRNERYDAEIYLECFWNDDEILKYVESQLKNNSQKDKLECLEEILSTIAYNREYHWSPQLYIENAIGDTKEETLHNLELVELQDGTLTVQVREARKIRGIFYERLELYDFPMDNQEISITLTSRKCNQDVKIVENKLDLCSVSTDEFLDQQEWDLYNYVKTEHKDIFDIRLKYSRPAFTVTGFIQRRPGYYLYNAYMLIFLITILGFVPFSFSPVVPQFRVQTTGLLILTAVNFRWVITQRLPSVSYLTSLDKYAIGNLLFLFTFCIWHSLIGCSLIASNEDTKRTIDVSVLALFACLHICYNLYFLLWFLKMAKKVKQLKEKFS